MKQLIVILAMSLCFLGCEKSQDGAAGAAEQAQSAECGCAEGKKGGTVWCDKCGSGYVKGEKTKDKAAVTAALAAVKPAAAAKPAAEKKAE